MILSYNSGMIGEIWKSMQYRNEPDRIRRNGRGWILQGDHREHHLICEDGSWQCDCDFFGGRGVCSHTMTMERIEPAAPAMILKCALAC